MPSESVTAVLYPFFNGSTSQARSSHGSILRQGRWVFSYHMPIVLRLYAEDKCVYVIVEQDTSPSQTTKKHITQAIACAEDVDVSIIRIPVQFPTPPSVEPPEHPDLWLAREIIQKSFEYAQSQRGIANSGAHDYVDRMAEAGRVLHYAERLRNTFNLPATVSHIKRAS